MIGIAILLTIQVILLSAIAAKLYEPKEMSLVRRKRSKSSSQKTNRLITRTEEKEAELEAQRAAELGWD